jgi:hypothetical protein
MELVIFASYFIKYSNDISSGISNCLGKFWNYIKTLKFQSSVHLLHAVLQCNLIYFSAVPFFHFYLVKCAQTGLLKNVSNKSFRTYRDLNFLPFTIFYVRMQNVKLSLCLTKYHAMKTYWGTGSTRVNPKVSGLVDNEINNNNKHSLRSNTKGYGGKTC